MHNDNGYNNKEWKTQLKISIFCVYVLSVIR